MSCGCAQDGNDGLLCCPLHLHAKAMRDALILAEPELIGQTRAIVHRLLTLIADDEHAV